MSRSIFLGSFKAFGGLFHQGRNIELDSIQDSTVLIEDSAVYRGRYWHLGLRLQGELLPAPIYHSVEFDAIWRFPSARPKHWVFSASQEDVPSARGGWTSPWFFYIDLHFVFSLWRLISSCREHFVAARILFTGAI